MPCSTHHQLTIAEGLQALALSCMMPVNKDKVNALPDCTSMLTIGPRSRGGTYTAIFDKQVVRFLRTLTTIEITIRCQCVYITVL